MDVLVLGGTSFVGRAIVADLLAREHVPTLFSRGRTGTDLFPGVERRVGDRTTGDYGALADGRWDAVIDVSGYVPQHVRAAVGVLAERVGRYVFISTGLVYDFRAGDGTVTESTPRLTALDTPEPDDDDSYGRLKVGCEDVLSAALGDRLSIVRPGYVVGPHDPTDRLTYWVRRAARGGPTAVPTRLDRPAQAIDARDLARLAVLLVEKDLPGAFNAVAPDPAITLGDLITACGNTDLRTVADDALDFPMLFPDASWDVMLRISAAAALAAGMTQTPLATTVADTRAWDLARGEPALTYGPTEEQERAALALA